MPTIVGTAANDILAGGDDADLIEALGGDDLADGGAGDDTVDGGAGADRLNGGTGNDRLLGGDADDILVGGAGDDHLDGGSGIDTVSYRSAPARVSIYLWDDRPQGWGEGQDTLLSVENVEGSSFNDLLVGDANRNQLLGVAGDDVLAGLESIDDLQGGAGNDVYYIASSGEHTAAEITDTSGYDTVRFASTQSETLTLFAEDKGIERVELALGTDLQSTPSDTFYERINIDARAVRNGLEIVGAKGPNTLLGTAFDDQIFGLFGDDLLTGGAGRDHLVGGDGLDTFRDTAAGLNGDTIADFGSGERIIITDAMLANFSFRLSGNMLTYTGGSLTLAGPVNGRLVASAAPEGGVELRIGPALVPATPPPPGPPNTQPIYLTPATTNFTVEAGNYLSRVATGASGSLFEQGFARLTNRGTIFVQDTPAWSGDLGLAQGYYSVVNLDNSGTIVVHEQSRVAGMARAIFDTGSSNQPTSFTNSGEFFVISDHFDARFLLTWQSDPVVTNSGLIAVYSPEGSSTAIEFANGGRVVNAAGGRILVEGLNAIGIVMPVGTMPGEGGNPVEVANAGHIEARGYGDYASVAIYVGAGEVANSGTIIGDVAVYLNGTLTNSGTIIGAVYSDSFIRVQNGGTIDGDLFGGEGTSLGDEINNRGLITGNVSLFAGDDVFSNVGGYVAGYVDLGSGADQFSGSGEGDEVYGGTGNDTLRGNGGDDYFEGDDGNDLLDGGAGFDMVSYAGAPLAVSVSLSIASAQSTGGAGVDTLLAIEDVIGSQFNDRLTGSREDNLLFGLAGADTLSGELGDDVLSGGEGADALIGGFGHDVFLDTAAGLNGDTIVDLSTGDRIVISDAEFATFTYFLSSNVLNFTGGSLTLSGGLAGQLVAGAAAGGGVELRVVGGPTVSAVRNDFNGDGRSDVLWRDGSGTLTNWLGQANGALAGNNANLFQNVDPSWKVVGTGDFNGDGRADVLWRHTSGALTDWLGQANGGLAGNAGFIQSVDTSWQVAGTGDFNGDGRADVLWRHSSGALTDWLGQPDGRFLANNANLFSQVDLSWRVAGTGDFNGDGRSDILWRHSSGALTDWLGQANGGFVANNGNAFQNVDGSWQVVGTGDFNGDGRSDVLWRHSSGALINWLGQANGGFAGNGSALDQVDRSWHVTAVGDYNGDGRDDILWRHDAGQVSQWLARTDGGFTSNHEIAGQQVGLAWQVQSPDILLV